MLERSPVFMLQGLDGHLWDQDKIQSGSVHTQKYTYVHTLTSVLSELLSNSFEQVIDNVLPEKWRVLILSWLVFLPTS